MPEGPEVRITVEQLNKLVIKQKLVAININSGRYSKKVPSGYHNFIEQLQKPDILFTISRMYGSEAHGMSYFFAGLETSRKDVVWKIFGIPLTFAVYQKVIGSLVSIIILSMTFALRSSVAL